MAVTASTMLPLGSPVPEFTLKDVDSGNEVSPDRYRGKPLLVMFLCNHCPYVKHVKGEIGRLAREFGADVAMVAINSNSLRSHPEDGPEHMARLKRAEGWPFPFCFDDTQGVAARFQAACTPEFYLFDAEHALAYRGQLDDSRPGSGVPVTGSDLRRAIESVLAGRKPEPDQKPSVGCNIKWDPGNEPVYFRGF